MKKRFSKKNLAAAIGTAVAASFSITPMVNAEQNPFGVTDLSYGYMELAEAAKKAEGSCGEGKCGGAMKKKMEEQAKKKKEGSCGEGKCGEGKCAGAKKKATTGTTGGAKKQGTTE